MQPKEAISISQNFNSKISKNVDQAIELFGFLMNSLFSFEKIGTVKSTTYIEKEKVDKQNTSNLL